MVVLGTVIDPMTQANGKIMTLRLLCISLVISLMLAACATTPRVFVPSPNGTIETGQPTQGVLQNSRLDGGFIYLKPVIDRRRARPEDFGRSDENLLAIKGASVPELVAQSVTDKLRRAGFSVKQLKKGEKLPTPMGFCPLELSITIERFWVLAEPMGYDGVAQTYRYFITLKTTMRSPKENIDFFKNHPLEITREVSRSEIDPFIDKAPNNEYLRRLHRTALNNLFTIHLKEISDNLWELVRQQSWCPALRGDPMPETFYE